jgi:hypothetical protein
MPPLGLVFEPGASSTTVDSRLDAPTPNLTDEHTIEHDELIWLVQKNGRVFSALDRACFHDMFWVGYRVVDLTCTPGDQEQLLSAGFWHEDPLPRFVHLFSDFVCDTAFAGGILPTRALPLVSMRALYLPAPRRSWLATWR